MDDRLKESISALMDDESNELELQRILSHDDKDEVQAVWAHYHEVRRVVKQDQESHFSIDISAGVAAAIRDETLAPVKLTATETTSSRPAVSLVEDKTVSNESKLGRSAWLALAASVAFALGFTLNGTDTNISDSIDTVASNAQPDTSLVKVAVVEEPKIIVEMTEEQTRHLGQYLLRHAEHSVRGTQSGFMPLARVASVNSVGI